MSLFGVRDCHFILLIERDLVNTPFSCYFLQLVYLMNCCIYSIRQYRFWVILFTSQSQVSKNFLGKDSPRISPQFTAFNNHYFLVQKVLYYNIRLKPKSVWLVQVSRYYQSIYKSNNEHFNCNYFTIRHSGNTSSYI